LDTKLTGKQPNEIKQYEVGKTLWKSKDHAFENDKMAGEIMKLFAKETVATATNTETKKDSESKEKEEKKEKEKTSLGRRILKSALVVAAVAGSIGAGIALAGTGAGWIGAGVAGVSFLTRVFSERSASTYVKQQNELLEKGTNSPEKKEQLEKLKKKENIARNISKGAKALLIYSSIFATSAIGWSIFGPSIQSMSVEIAVKLNGLFQGINVTPVTEPFTSGMNAGMQFGTTPPIVPIP
jgi:23S rRNA A1618 N6-methylase RlmF